MTVIVTVRERKPRTTAFIARPPAVSPEEPMKGARWEVTHRFESETVKGALTEVFELLSGNPHCAVSIMHKR